MTDVVVLFSSYKNRFKVFVYEDVPKRSTRIYERNEAISVKITGTRTRSGRYRS